MRFSLKLIDVNGDKLQNGRPISSHIFSSTTKNTSRYEVIVNTGCFLREYVFSDFTQAFDFMTEIALIAERINHHPEWQNIYKKVNVNLSTHEADGITERDFYLAEEMEKIATAR